MDTILLSLNIGVFCNCHLFIRNYIADISFIFLMILMSLFSIMLGCYWKRLAILFPAKYTFRNRANASPYHYLYILSAYLLPLSSRAKTSKNITFVVWPLIYLISSVFSICCHNGNRNTLSLKFQVFNCHSS